MLRSTHHPHPHFHAGRWAHPHHRLVRRWVSWMAFATAVAAGVALSVDVVLKSTGEMIETPVCEPGIGTECRSAVRGGPGVVQPACRTVGALSDALAALRYGDLVLGQHPDCRGLAAGTAVLVLPGTLHAGRSLGTVVQVYPQHPQDDTFALWMDSRNLSPSPHR